MNVYERLGVRTMVNAWGTHSYIGGSVPRPEVLASMVEASRYFVNTYELQRAVGKRLAELTKNEAAFVSVSAAAGLLLAGAAAMAGADPRKRDQLPDTTGMKHIALAQAVNRNPYAHCVLPAGMRVRWVGDAERGPSEDELEAAIDSQVACSLYFVDREYDGRQLDLDRVVDVCHRHGVPVIVDAAAQIPPFENTWRFTREMGADVAIFSGGKGLRGPQSSGLVVGTEAMIEAIRVFCPPIPSVARAAKASRELIVGLLTAVELMSMESSAALIAEIEHRLDFIHRRLAEVPGLTIRKRFGTDKKPFHHLEVAVDSRVTGIDGQTLARRLDAGTPRVAVGEVSFNAPWLDIPEGEIVINAEMLRPGEEYIVVGRFLEILNASAQAQEGRG